MDKVCFKCGEEKSIDDFYVHPQMKDGHLNKCKECTKADVRRRLDEKPEVVHAYDRLRGRSPLRRAAQVAYQRESRRRDRAKMALRNKTARAIASGKLIRQPCQVCGNPNVEAHHPDYSKPLEVVWLCFKHHREIHGHRVSA